MKIKVKSEDLERINAKLGSFKEEFLNSRTMLHSRYANENEVLFILLEDILDDYKASFNVKKSLSNK